MVVTPLVELHDVSKRYGAAPSPLVLDRVSLSAAPGEIVSLIGPSGCGKSTILRLIAGLSPISGGSLTVAGHAPDAGAAELAFVFQDATLLPWLTVERNIELPLKLRKIDAAQRAESVTHVLELVGLADKAGAYPRQLSGGQKMRVSLARALALAPQLLLLDEPFGALDEITREHLNEELLAIREQRSWTAFFVTHSVAEAVFLSTRIVVLRANPGRVHADIEVDLPHPRTAETRLSRAYHDLVAEVSRVLRSVETAAAKP
jgi:NitT/TauT family transport system ATP-binding protein